MTPNEYQELSKRTLTMEMTRDIAPSDLALVAVALGLSDEAGEVAGAIKKGIFHRHGIDREKLKEELGDVLWYHAAICTLLGFTVEEVMEANVEKLIERYPNGFNREASIARVDVVKPKQLTTEGE